MEEIVGGKTNEKAERVREEEKREINDMNKNYRNHHILSKFNTWKSLACDQTQTYPTKLAVQRISSYPLLGNENL
jgi:hypothetical protein